MNRRLLLLVAFSVLSFTAGVFARGSFAPYVTWCVDYPTVKISVQVSDYGQSRDVMFSQAIDKIDDAKRDISVKR